MRLFLFLIILSSWLYGMAEVLTPEEALQRAMPSNPNVQRMKARPMDLVLTDSMAQPAYYVFSPSTHHGFMIVSADDRVVPLLGYSDTEIFDTERMPENMKFWLQFYSQQIAQARERGIKCEIQSNGLEGKEPIPPLMTWQWGQEEPYNNRCPIFDGERSMTGCVSTALSQIMRFHKYPEHGTGSFSYELEGEMIEADFESTYYDWENMLDTYTEEYSDAEANAVATLMMNTGVAFEMGYSPYGSGAVADMPVRRMPIYFDYDDHIFFAWRRWHPLAEWNQIIYNQLANVGPVEYNGADDLGFGHSFVCDGYDGDGYFHINWGWAGLSNGYYLLDILDPEDQGIGGGTDAFVNRMAIQGGIQPAGREYIHYELTLDMFSILAGEYSTVDKLFGLIPADQILFQFTFLYNYNHCNVSGQVGAKFTDKNNGEEIILELPSTFDYAYGKGSTPNAKITTPNDMPKGEYVVTPIWKDSKGEWHEIYVKTGAQRSVDITVEKDKWIVAEAPKQAALSCVDLEASETFVWTKPCPMKFTLQNTGGEEYYGTVRAVIINDDKQICGSTPSFVVSLSGNDQQSYTLELPFILYQYEEPQTGKYMLYLADSFSIPFSNGVEVYMHRLEDIPALAIQEMELATKNIEWDTPFAARLVFFNLRSNSGTAQYQFGLYKIVDGTTSLDKSALVATSPTYDVELSEEESVEIDTQFIINQSLEEEIPGSGEYVLTINNSDAEVLYFTYVDFTGRSTIESITEDNVKITIDGHKVSIINPTTTITHIYGIDGREILQTHELQFYLPTSGVYILKHDNSIRKLILQH